MVKINGRYCGDLHGRIMSFMALQTTRVDVDLAPIWFTSIIATLRKKVTVALSSALRADRDDGRRDSFFSCHQPRDKHVK